MKIPMDLMLIKFYFLDAFHSMYSKFQIVLYRSRQQWERILLRAGVVNARLIHTREDAAPLMISSVLYTKDNEPIKVINKSIIPFHSRFTFMKRTLQNVFRLLFLLYLLCRMKIVIRPKISFV